MFIHFVFLVHSECVMFYFLFSQRMEKSEVELGREEGAGGFAHRTGKDLNENNQKATVTKEIAGKRIKRKDTFCFDE